MKKYLHKNKGFTTILFTIIVMFLVSIVVFSFLFLCVYEYRSISNYSHYEQAYYLALGAQEEAKAKLSSNWNTTTDTSWIPLGTGEYQYKITVLSPTRKKIISQGRATTISRKFECIVQIPLAITDLHYFTNYSLYCNGDLKIQNLGEIAQKDSKTPGIIGVTGNLLVNSITRGSSPMDVVGNISLNQTSKNNYFEMYPLIDSNLPLCEIADGSSYITWLADKYPDKIHYIEIESNKEFILDETTNPTEEGVWDICIVKGGESLHVKDLHFDGLFIAENMKKIQIEDSATIEGMTMVFGAKTDCVNIHGNIVGNVSILSMSCVANFSGRLVYDQEILGNIMSFLSYNEVNNSTTYDLTMIKWNEVE